MRNFGLEVVGDAMAPVILEGDVLQVDPSQQPRSNGKDLAVLRVNGAYHVCKYTKMGLQILMLHENAPIMVARSYEVEIVGLVTGINEENHSAGNTAAFEKIII